MNSTDWETVNNRITRRKTLEAFVSLLRPRIRPLLMFQSFVTLIAEEYDSWDSIGGDCTKRMNSTDWERGLEAAAEAATTAELVIEGILIPILAVPGVIG